MVETQAVSPTKAEEPRQIGPEVLVHERIDDWIGDVVGEIKIEDDGVVGDQLESHEERRKEGDDEDDGHDEQHGRRFQIGQTIHVDSTRPPIGRLIPAQRWIPAHFQFVVAGHQRVFGLTVLPLVPARSDRRSQGLDDCQTLPFLQQT